MLGLKLNHVSKRDYWAIHDMADSENIRVTFD